MLRAPRELGGGAGGLTSPNGGGIGQVDDALTSNVDVTAATTSTAAEDQPPAKKAAAKEKHAARRRRSRSPTGGGSVAANKIVAAAAASVAAGFFRRLRRKGNNNNNSAPAAAATATTTKAGPSSSPLKQPPTSSSPPRSSAAERTATTAAATAPSTSVVPPPSPPPSPKNNDDKNALDLDLLLPPHPPPHATLAPLRMGAATDRGARPYQEDRHACVAPLAPLDSAGLAAGEREERLPRSYAAVFDGHSGSDAATLASERLHALLAREPALRLCSGSGDPERALKSDAPLMAAALRAAFASVDAEILARCRGRGGREGTTALVALRVGSQLWTAHLGDARAVLARVEREKSSRVEKGKKEKKKKANSSRKGNEEGNGASASDDDDEGEGEEDNARTPSPPSDDDDDNAASVGPTIITRSPQSPMPPPPPPLPQPRPHLPPFLRSFWQQNGNIGANATAANNGNAPAANASAPLSSSTSTSSRIKAVRLTHDHKPDLPHERARVLAAGGRVEWQGCWRVVAESPLPGRPAAGLAVSRSLGDAQFKEPLPLVSSDPDVSVTLLRPGDTLLILASDGVWDVLSDQDAAEVAVAAALKAVAAASEEEDEEEEKEVKEEEEEEKGAAAEENGGRGKAAEANAVKREGEASGAPLKRGGSAEGKEEPKTSDEKKKEVDKVNSDDDDDDPSSLGLNVPLRTGCPIATAAAAAVIEAALARRTMDNVTALCAVLPWEW